MGAAIVSMHNAGKAYASWASPRERFWSLFTGSAPREPFWALRNISLRIERGTALGIVGVNGAGKSTLMQMIAGTVEPTEGSVTVNGRVSPLLELGAGFNFDFTGWENAELAGAILGLSSVELRAKLDAIAEFADIGPFMDRPVKMYSSGMFARLAFSVAIHVEPEILLIDEILAVGDLGFQQRCLLRLREMRERGLTLVFVSHSPDAIKSVCGQALFLHRGRAMYFGTADQAVDRYLALVREEANKRHLLLETSWNGPRTKADGEGSLRYGTGHVQIQRIDMRNGTGERRREFGLGEAIVIDMAIHSSIDVKNLSASFLIRDATGVDILGTTTFDERVELPPLREGASKRVRFSFVNCLRPGTYGVSVAVSRVSQRDYTDNILFDQIDGVASFVVTADPIRPVHYKIHQPVTISFAEANAP
ncbi:MAG TPA: ABC transporter ATP-binding protein [Gemmataceae bacterium]|nr:ABC transporter ATP-binding protein [Gemmataceae bacterium]